MELKPNFQKYHWGRIAENSRVARIMKAADPSFQIEPRQPYAELWMGTHGNGPSIIKKDNMLLSDYLKGRGAGKRTELPFLLKVLSINNPLSIQAHPDKLHAEQLHAAKPDLYKDGNHKPELAVALSEFQALCGFRPYEEIQNFLRRIPPLAALIGNSLVEEFFNNPTAETLKPCFGTMMSSSDKNIQNCIADVKRVLSQSTAELKVFLFDKLFEKLTGQFPGDVGALCIYFLNVMYVKPGEGIYLGPNIPHAYISGDCVEVMACSDNVVRAGLTPKFKDVDTLINMLDYTGKNYEKQYLKPEKVNKYTVLFKPPINDFALLKIQVKVGTCDNFAMDLKKKTDSIIIVINGGAQTTMGEISTGSIIFVPENDEFEILSVVGDFEMYQAFYDESF